MSHYAICSLHSAPSLPLQCLCFSAEMHDPTGAASDDVVVPEKTRNQKLGHFRFRCHGAKMSHVSKRINFSVGEIYVGLGLGGFSSHVCAEKVRGRC